jgi:methylphosphotriester-DNA--protein-cysteine methyltransferase
MPATTERRDLVARFEALLQTEPEHFLSISKICAALGVSAQMLRKSCEEQLGMGPSEYVRRWRMQHVHRALRNGNPATASVPKIARRYGFRDPGRFATNYQAVYGELPSATLRRSLRGIAKLSLHRPV